MKSILIAAILLITLSSSAQYYYKDIVGTKESSDLIKAYLKNKVSRVVVTSYDDDVKTNNLFIQQEFSPATKTLKTITATGEDNGNASALYSYADADGNVIRTVDSSGIVVSITNYNYDPSGKLISVTTSSADTVSSQWEQHIWQWNNEKPLAMLRIKNKTDTTYVNFKLDENGNITEETATQKKVPAKPYYYYYNENNQLTDVVRYNERAKQLLPEYMFEYANNKVVQKITIPTNNSDYLIWRYQYGSNGLKIKEVVYSKHDKKNPVGKVEYQYSFAQ